VSDNKHKNRWDVYWYINGARQKPKSFTYDNGVDTKQKALDKAIAYRSALDNARGYCKNGIRPK